MHALNPELFKRVKEVMVVRLLSPLRMTTFKIDRTEHIMTAHLVHKALKIPCNDSSSRKAVSEEAEPTLH